jgi:hypothetical protein
VSAIQPQQLEVSGVADEPVRVILESSTQLISETILPDDEDELPVPQEYNIGEPSPVKILTHKRSNSLTQRHAVNITPSSTSTTSRRISPVNQQRFDRRFMSEQNTGKRMSEMSTIEREVRAAEQGRLRLLEQIKINRKTFETLKRENEVLTGRRKSPIFDQFKMPTVTTTMSSVTRSARLARTTATDLYTRPTSIPQKIQTNLIPATSVVPRTVYPTRQVEQTRRTTHSLLRHSSPPSSLAPPQNRLSRSYIMSGASNRSCSVDVSARPSMLSSMVGGSTRRTSTNRSPSLLNRSIRGNGPGTEYRPPWR